MGKGGGSSVHNNYNANNANGEYNNPLKDRILAAQGKNEEYNNSYVDRKSAADDARQNEELYKIRIRDAENAAKERAEANRRITAEKIERRQRKEAAVQQEIQPGGRRNKKTNKKSKKSRKSRRKKSAK